MSRSSVGCPALGNSVDAHAASSPHRATKSSSRPGFTFQTPDVYGLPMSSMLPGALAVTQQSPRRTGERLVSAWWPRSWTFFVAWG